MSEVVESSKSREPRGGGSGGGSGGKANSSHNGVSSTSNDNFNQAQQAAQHQVATAAATQDFNWSQQRNQMHQEAYSNFYYPGAAAHHAAAGYSPFSGDIRDSIAAIWSRTSPSGEGFAAASGGYGHQAGEGFAAHAAHHAAGQFAANLNFATATSELSMFGAAAAAGAGDYTAHAAAYGQYGFGPQYTQWPENGGSNNGGGSSRYSRDSLMDVQHGLEGMKLKKDQNGSKSASSKMSWASVASQPAKPQPQPKTVKKPGVLPPPAIIPSSSSTKAPPAPQQTPSEKMIVNQPPPLAGMPPAAAAAPPPPQTAVMTNPALMMQQPPSMVMNNVDYRHHHPPPPQPRNMVNNQGGPRRPQNQQAIPQSNGGMPHHAAAAAPTAKVYNNVSAAQHPVLENLKSVNEYNPKSFDLSPKNARYFVIKSFSEDDVHRSIKYEIWCSTEHGNKRLDAAFKAQNGQGPIYLFFSVNGSGHFCGMAEMLSSVDYSNTGGSVWVQDKFKGQFKVKWIYVKDVPNPQLRHIRLENNENKPVTNSRDTQEVPGDKGRMVLKIFHSFKHITSLFDDFTHYEKRQEEEKNKKKEHEVMQHEHHRQGQPRERHHDDHRPRPRRDHRGGDRENHHHNRGSERGNNKSQRHQ